MEEEKVDRVKMIEAYLQNQQHEIDKGLFVYVQLLIWFDHSFLRTFPDLNMNVHRTFQNDNNISQFKWTDSPRPMQIQMHLLA